MSENVSVYKIQVGDIPGPIGLTCMEGETVWNAFYRVSSSGELGQIAMCVPNDRMPCDDGGFWDLLAAAELIQDPDPCV